MGNVNKPHQTVADSKYPRRPSNQSGDGVIKEKEIQPLTEEDYQQLQDTLSSGKNEEDWRISVQHKLVLRRTWTVLQRNLESIGVVTFLKLFETHPDTLRPFIRDVYTVKELELNEWYRENLKVHALRVMAVVEKAMHRLDDEVRAGQILIAYGHRHYSMGVTLNMLTMMGSSFVIAIQPCLEEAGEWSSIVEEAWLALFKFIVFCMRQAYPGDREEYQGGAAGRNVMDTTAKMELN